MSVAATITTGSVSLDQAIFSSVRSPTGVGYRIIAASPSVSRQEKGEIIRRAPSHASLDQPDPDAVAMLAFPIGTDRYCVSLSQHAGREHTGRGGERVHTHFVILNRDDYERFGTNPLNVHAALRCVVGGSPQLKPPASLGQLALRTAPKVLLVQPCHGAPSCRVEAVLQICLAMLQSEKLLVTDSLDGHPLLDQAMACLPAKLRRCLALSIGLNPSPSRRLQLCIVRPDKVQTRGTPGGRKARSLDAQDPPKREASHCDAWLDLIKRRLEDGRLADIARLTADMTEDARPETLAAIASLCSDIDAVAKARPEELARLMAKHRHTTTAQTPEAGLLQRFHNEAQRRAVELQEPHPA